MKREDIKQIAYTIISSKEHGTEFYTNEMFNSLIDKICIIVKELNLNSGTDYEKISKVNEYLKSNVTVRKSYFDAFREEIPEIPKEELIYRTSYGALVMGEAMCAGFTESARILLEISGLKTKTLLSKLPGKNKYLLHYVTAIKYDRGSGRDFYIMDPEREHSCEQKGYDFRRYLMEMTYILPEQYFFENKVGKNGVGPCADEYLANIKPKHVLSKNNVDELFIDEKGVNSENGK